MRVVIVQEHLPHYRVALYEELREILFLHNIHLDLIFNPNTASNLLPGTIAWATPVSITKFGSLSWQPIFPLLRKSNLIIVQQEVKYVANYLLLAKRSFSPALKLAFWGHGKNFQATYKSFFAEFLKRRLSTKCDWWFAYNDLSCKIITSLGFPSDRISTLYNSIDTVSLAHNFNQTSHTEIARVRESLEIKTENIAIYSGGLYEEKRIPFLIKSSIEVRKHLPDFVLLICGSGREAEFVKAASRTYPFIKYLGPLGDKERLPYWKISKLLLMPGAVGLVVLDSFAFKVPMITTAIHTHGPEIDYLRNGVNGLILDGSTSPEAYANSIVALFQDEEARQKIAVGCAKSAPLYTTDRTAKLFAEGIRQALAAPSYEHGRIV